MRPWQLHVCRRSATACMAAARLRNWGALVFLALGCGCSFMPEGVTAEQERVAAAGKGYQQAFAERTLPEVPAVPTWRDLLHRAFMANGELESAWFEWQAAMERIGIASAWPNSKVMLGYSVAFGPDHMKAFDRMTFSAGVDTMANLAFPAKTAREGQIALDAARAAGERFRAAKFALQERVLSSWYDYVFTAERLRVQTQQVALWRIAFDTARTRVVAGGVQADLLRAEVGLREAEYVQLMRQAELAATRSQLNGMLARDAGEALAPPPSLPAPRPLAADDAALLAAAAAQNADLAALARAVDGRADLLERARLEWVPDINPMAAFTGSLVQTLGVSIMLPTTIRQINGGIREAEAMLRGAEARLRQVRGDKAAAVVATLVSLRDSERQAKLFEETIVPVTERIVGTVTVQYSADRASWLDLIDAQRTLLEARIAGAQARTMREKRLAELEALIGFDVETLEGKPAEPPRRTP